MAGIALHKDIAMIPPLRDPARLGTARKKKPGRSGRDDTRRSANSREKRNRLKPVLPEQAGTTPTSEDGRYNGDEKGYRRTDLK
jgi:hypothetical protein